VSITQIRVLPALHKELTARLRAISVYTGVTQSREMVVDQTRINDVKCLLASFNALMNKRQQNAVLLLWRMKERAYVPLRTERRIGKMNRLFASRHRIAPR
jgi:hypothetical protein